MGFWTAAHRKTQQLEVEKRQDAADALTAEKYASDIAYRDRQEALGLKQYNLTEKAANLKEIQILKSFAKSAGADVGASGTGTAKTTGPSKEQSISILSSMGVSDEKITILAGKSPQALSAAATMAQALKEKAGTRSNIDFGGIIGSAIDGAITTKGKLPDWNVFAAELGIELEDADLTLLNSTPVNDETYIPPMSLPKVYTESEIEGIQKLAVGNALSAATVDLEAIDKRAGEIVELRAGGNTDPILAAETAWMDTRRIQLSDAVGSAAGKTPNYAPLINLYGNSLMPQLQNYYADLEEAPLQSIFSQAEPIVIDIGTESMLSPLSNSGFIRVGDRVTYKTTVTKENPISVQVTNTVRN